MRDPHVVELIYTVETDGSVQYLDPPPLEHQTPGFDFRLAAGCLTISMKVHCALVDAARRAVEPFLRTWEAAVYVASGKEELRFEFASAEIIDRDPSPEGGAIMPMLVAHGAGRVFTPQVVEGRKEYPKPPQHFVLSPDVEVLLVRYRAYKQEREPLLAMAYFCLTVIETRASGRLNATQIFAIDFPVLRKIGELTSTRGDATSARKYNPKQQSLTPLERRWLDAAIRGLIRQVAEVDAGKQPAILRLQGLPLL